jgi:hypothetical protein
MSCLSNFFGETVEAVVEADIHCIGMVHINSRLAARTIAAGRKADRLKAKQ